MVTITGSKKEIALIIEMLNSSDTSACAYTAKDMKKNQFAIQGSFNGEDLDFAVEYSMRKESI